MPITERRFSLEIDCWPGPELSPNSRCHWRVKQRATRTFRQRVWALAYDAALPGMGEAKIRITYIVPDRRQRDPDNFLAMFKSGIDGLVDAGVLAADSAEYLTILPVQFEYRKGVKAIRVDFLR